MICLGGLNSNICKLSLTLQIKNFKHQPFSSLISDKISHYEIPSSTFSSSAHASGFSPNALDFHQNIIVREARIEDCWEVAETHCSSFFPEYSFPLDFMLRFDRLVGMLFGFSIPKGCKRSCLVAVTESCGEDSFFIGSDDYFKIGKINLGKGYVTGILTVDTVADFLPRKGPFRQRRIGIAYVSNVAVRENFRRKGIAKKLIAKAEAKAKSWGCRAIALHCDLNNPGATKLYTSQGFKCIRVPQGAKWPHPKISPETQFNFMMKLLNSS
ncbi:acyl-CoA N-acyltransferases superfamily protein [Striga asiatica]|uniref:Acyl-CoA N-acyltransferases superfamily protein n=1 Tax=Striga asiatica TaxID=4170 RepID=A0A5A7R1R2_STRAF|nr:acyl-CoA N-acyltransferases superfamily protein [Striga asiatica]